MSIPSIIDCFKMGKIDFFFQSVLGEFKQYFKLLENKLKFKPVYKYYGCIDCKVENSLSETPENSCVRSNDFCGYTNHSKFNI